MSFRYPLKIVVEGEYDVKLYPEDGETTTILNFKRGIISALAVPLLDEDKNKNMVFRLRKLGQSYCIHTKKYTSDMSSLYIHHLYISPLSMASAGPTTPLMPERTLPLRSAWTEICLDVIILNQ